MAKKKAAQVKKPVPVAKTPTKAIEQSPEPTPEPPIEPTPSPKPEPTLPEPQEDSLWGFVAAKASKPKNQEKDFVPEVKIEQPKKDQHFHPELDGWGDNEPDGWGLDVGADLDVWGEPGLTTTPKPIKAPTTTTTSKAKTVSPSANLPPVKPASSAKAVPASLAATSKSATKSTPPPPLKSKTKPVSTATSAFASSSKPKRIINPTAPTPATRARALWTLFKGWHTTHLQSISQTLASTLSTMHTLYISTPVHARPSPGEHASRRSEIVRDWVLQQIDEIVALSQQEWIKRLGQEGLQPEDWDYEDMSEEEKYEVEKILGGGDVEDWVKIFLSIVEDESPSAVEDVERDVQVQTHLAVPGLSNDTRSSNVSTSSAYSFVNPSLFGHDDNDQYVEDDGGEDGFERVFDMANLSGPPSPIGHPSTSGWDSSHYDSQPHTPHTPSMGMGWVSEHSSPPSVRSLSMSLSEFEPEYSAAGWQTWAASTANTTPGSSRHNSEHSSPKMGVTSASGYFGIKSASRATPLPRVDFDAEEGEVGDDDDDDRQTPRRASHRTKPTSRAARHIGPKLWDQGDVVGLGLEEGPSSGTTSANSSLAELENAFKTFKLDARLSKIKEFHDEAADLDVELVYTIQGIVGREDESSVRLNSKEITNLVAQHEARMSALKESKDEERKRLVDDERRRMLKEWDRQRAEKEKKKAPLVPSKKGPASKAKPSTPPISTPVPTPSTSSPASWKSNGKQKPDARPKPEFLSRSSASGSLAAKAPTKGGDAAQRSQAAPPVEKKSALKSLASSITSSLYASTPTPQPPAKKGKVEIETEDERRLKEFARQQREEAARHQERRKEEDVSPWEAEVLRKEADSAREARRREEEAYRQEAERRHRLQLTNATSSSSRKAKSERASVAFSLDEPTDDWARVSAHSSSDHESSGHRHGDTEYSGFLATLEGSRSSPTAMPGAWGEPTPVFSTSSTKTVSRVKETRALEAAVDLKRPTSAWKSSSSQSTTTLATSKSSASTPMTTPSSSMNPSLTVSSSLAPPSSIKTSSSNISTTSTSKFNGYRGAESHAFWVPASAPSTENANKPPNPPIPSTSSAHSLASAPTAASQRNAEIWRPPGASTSATSKAKAEPKTVAGTTKVPEKTIVRSERAKVPQPTSTKSKPSKIVSTKSKVTIEDAADSSDERDQVAPLPKDSRFVMEDLEGEEDHRLDRVLEVVNTGDLVEPQPTHLPSHFDKIYTYAGSEPADDADGFTTTTPKVAKSGTTTKKKPEKLNPKPPASSTSLPLSSSSAIEQGKNVTWGTPSTQIPPTTSKPKLHSRQVSFASDPPSNGPPRDMAKSTASNGDDELEVVTRGAMQSLWGLR